ncbi:hypothetical protein OROHE_008736 [Orobanche hederae]
MAITHQTLRTSLDNGNILKEDIKKLPSIRSIHFIASRKAGFSRGQSLLQVL